jgi:hypothetical protein
MSAEVTTDEQLLTLDVAAMITAGFAPEDVRPEHARRWLFAEAAVAAALRADRAGVFPRSLTFLAEIVRRGGVGYASRLPEPLPTAEQTEVIRPWLAAAEAAGESAAFARWLDAVASILATRRDVIRP